MEEISDLRPDEKPTSCTRPVLQTLACFVDQLCSWQDWSGCNSDPEPTRFTSPYIHFHWLPNFTRVFHFFKSLFTLSDAILKSLRLRLIAAAPCTPRHAAPVREVFTAERESGCRLTALASSRRLVGWEQIRSRWEEEMRLSSRRKNICEEKKLSAAPVFCQLILPFFNFLCVRCSSCWYHTCKRYLKYAVHAFYSLSFQI